MLKEWEWNRTKNQKFLVRSPTPARVLKQLSSCLRLQMKKTKFSSKMLFRAWKANSFDTCFASFICHLKAVLWAITVACHARLISRLQQFTKLLKLRYSFITKSDRSWDTFCLAFPFYFDFLVDKDVNFVMIISKLFYEEVLLCKRQKQFWQPSYLSFLMSLD